jgi:elongation factor G
MSTAIEALRNVAFVGHPSSGKTTLVDALAFSLGAASRKGSVADKTSLCDTEPEEQDKGHTLQQAVVQAEKNGKSWTLMDTPGYPDFMVDVNSAIFASDVTVGVHSAAGGVTFNFRKKMEAASARGKGRAIVITHVDGDNADFEASVEELRSTVGEICVPVLLPDASGPGFSAVSSVLEAVGSDWRKRLMDRIMDACEDEEMLEKYLETETLDDADLHAQLPGAIAAGCLVPVMACNPETDVGVDEIVAFLAEFAPHPGLSEQRDVDGNAIALDPEGDLLGVVFDIKSDPHVGKVCTARILRGTIGSHDLVGGTDSDAKGEKLGGLFRQVGKQRDAIETGKPGEIVAFSKVEHVHWGQTFTAAGGSPAAVIPPANPTPMVSLAVKPKSRADEQKIGEALHKLEAEDPSFQTEVNAGTHELVMHGMSDLHLQVIESRLKRRYGVEIETSIPRIQYKETITKAAEGHHRHKKQTGGRGQFGECYIRLKPLEKNAGVVFTDAIVGGSIPRGLIPAVEKGMREICSSGVLTDSEVVDLDFELYDGKYHDVDSDESSFKMAGSRAFIDAFQKAAPVLLEPIVELVISVPTDSAGQIFSDLTSQRRGHVLDQWNEADGAVTVIKAHAPLATVQTYQRDLKSQTAGEGSYSMEMVDYAALPPQEQQKILTASSKKHDEE